MSNNPQTDGTKPPGALNLLTKRRSWMLLVLGIPVVVVTSIDLYKRFYGEQTRATAQQAPDMPFVIRGKRAKDQGQGQDKGGADKDGFDFEEIIKEFEATRKA
ncbi:hypothetical protein H4R35_000440 [Dimargaris xerosporica]|nr:hypothetical protein H4R35_000440 [Dimargaris xerosporica]